jgi:AcrR family transcriptional regulator
VAGALALVEQSGSADAVTLRSVARRVGIAAPSIYAHFPDREAILWAVVEQVFDDLTAAVEAAVAVSADPVDRLVAGCEAYVAFGLAHPAAYRVLFSRQFHPPASAGAPPSPPPGAPPRGATIGAPTMLLDDRFPPVGGEVFALLVHGIERCADVGRSASVDPFVDATAVWVALHGIVSMRAAVPDFPWPEGGLLVRRVVLPLARIA